MTTRDVKCSVFHTNEKQEKSSTCCCIKYWNQTFEELLSTNGISSKLCALTVSPLFYPFPILISNNAVSSDYPNASQAPFVANQRTNRLLISQSFLNDHCPVCLSKQKNTLSTGISGVTFFQSHHRLLGFLICQPPPRRPALLLPAEEHIGDIAVAIWTRALF